LFFVSFDIDSKEYKRNDEAAMSICTLINLLIIMSQRHISQIDAHVDLDEVPSSHSNDLLAGSYTIKVLAYKADSSLNSTNECSVELHIGEREKIGQGTFGFELFSFFFFMSQSFN